MPEITISMAAGRTALRRPHEPHHAALVKNLGVDPMPS